MGGLCTWLGDIFDDLKLHLLEVWYSSGKGNINFIKQMLLLAKLNVNQVILPINIATLLHCHTRSQWKNCIDLTFMVLSLAAEHC